MSDKYTVRFGKPEEAKEFARWAIENDKIPHMDVVSVLKENNPTAVYLVIEKEGTPILYVPIYAQVNVGFLGFNPDIKGKARLAALGELKESLKNFAKSFGINEITVQTSPDYPVGKWALKHGFREEKRQTFKLLVEKQIDPFVRQEV